MKLNESALRLWGGVVVAVALLFPLSVHAQQGKLSGSVQDPHNAIVAGAKVKITNLTTKKVYSAVTNSEGEYTIAGLAAGEYEVDAEAPGFKPAAIGRIKVAETGETRQNVQLSVSGISDSITVNGLSLDTNVKTQTQTTLLEIPLGIAVDTVEFTSKDIEALHPATLLDVLQQVTGVQLTFQGRQHMNFMTMRGGNFQVIIDGVYLSQGDRTLAMLPPQLVESMTVVLDSTALSVGPLANFGSTLGGGISGVGNQGFVIIRTKRSAKLEAGVVSSGGNWATAMGHAYIGNKSGHWDYRTAYTYDTSSGKDLYNMGYRNGALTFHGGYTSSKLNFDFMYYGSRGMRQEEFGIIYWAAPSMTSGCIVSATTHNAVGDHCATNFNLNTNDGDLYAFNSSWHWSDRNRTVLQVGFDTMHINSQTTATTPQWQDSTESDVLLKHTLQFKGNSITGGGQAMKYNSPSSSNTSEMRSWFVQDEYPLLEGKLVLDGGIRGDYLHNGAYNATLKGASTVWQPLFTLSFGSAYRITPKVLLDARYGLVNTPPSSHYVTPTSTLLPNMKQNRGELSMNVTLNPHFNPRIAIYVYDTKNATTSASACIAPANADTGAGKAASYWTVGGVEYDCVTPAGEVKTAGTDMSISGRVAGPFNYKAGYGYIATDTGSINNTMMHNFANASLNYQQKSWFGSLSLAYNGPLNTSTNLGASDIAKYGFPAYVRAGDFTRIDANGGYNFKLNAQPMKFTGYIRNLTNNHYFTMYKTGAYVDPGRQYGVELAVPIF